MSQSPDAGRSCQAPGGPTRTRAETSRTAAGAQPGNDDIMANGDDGLISRRGICYCSGRRTSPATGRVLAGRSQTARSALMLENIPKYVVTRTLSTGTGVGLIDNAHHRPG